MALLGLRRWREQRFREPIAEAIGQGDPADLARLLIRLPAAARDIAADDDLDRQDVDLAAQHHPTAERLGGGLVIVARRVRGPDDRVAELLGQIGGVGREEVVRNEPCRLAEPEPGEAGQHPALVGDGRGQHHVERGEPVGGDEQQPSVSEAIEVADLARPDESASERHGSNPPGGRGGR